MFYKKRIEELEYEVSCLKRSLEWRIGTIGALAERVRNLEKSHRDLITFLGIKHKECKPGLEYIKHD